MICTVVLRWNYQIKNDEKKISSESINLLSRPSEKPRFSLIELALFEKMDFEVYLIKSVHTEFARANWPTPNHCDCHSFDAGGMKIPHNVAKM